MNSTVIDIEDDCMNTVTGENELKAVDFTPDEAQNDEGCNLQSNQQVGFTETSPEDLEDKM